MGPVDAFGFDAAILFSDLLFPLEHMNMGLRYDPGPILGRRLEDPRQLAGMVPRTPPGSSSPSRARPAA